ncbi:RIP metalloprotease RseP [Teredinibacter turnerae]|uniref:RIP metalloprotease RseP n=1 Tax=Teredinibacter turnerae TaxID=2426 RepID=UPI000375E55E|nr:RIP metalloprotease RseP [Teredinibacter turnerae]
MQLISTVFYFLIALMILVAIHEFGHFYVARRCGVRVLRFSIGFGNRLFSWRDKQGTEYAISAIPLGGYVKMLDEREGEVAPEDLPYTYNHKSPPQRIAIAMAGPLANLILAFTLYWVFFFLRGGVTLAPVIGAVDAGSIAAAAGLEKGQEIVAVDGRAVHSRRDVELMLLNRVGETGQITFVVTYPGSDLQYESRANINGWMQDVVAPDLVKGVGIRFFEPKIATEIGTVEPESAAARAGFKEGDRILEADGVAMEDGRQWIDYVRAHPAEEIRVLVARGNGREELFLTPGVKKDSAGIEYGFAGVSLPQVDSWPEEMVRFQHYGPLDSAVKAAQETRDVVTMVLLSVKKLVVGEISTKNLSGPIGIAKVAGDSAKAGIWAFVNFLAYISVLLGVFNLLPIPVLDGGHIVYGLIEWVKGSPVSEKVQVWGYQVGMALILGLMAIAFYHDIMRL